MDFQDSKGHTDRTERLWTFGLNLLDTSTEIIKGLENQYGVIKELDQNLEHRGGLVTKVSNITRLGEIFLLHL